VLLRTRSDEVSMELTPSIYPSGRQDLNLRPLDPQSSALPSCATSRHPAYADQAATEPVDSIAPTTAVSRVASPAP
jgi:hypothetical protein